MATPSARDLARRLSEDYAGLPAGTRVASEHELMRAHDVPRSVARRAVDELVERYELRRVQGAGTFVNRRVDYVISSRNPPSLHATVAAAGGTARTFVLDVGTHPVPDGVAQRLAAKPGEPLTRIRRLGYVDDMVASTVEEWIAPGVLDHADVSLRVVESLHEILRMGGHDPVRAWSRAAQEYAPDDVCARLEVDGRPLWVVETVSRDARTERLLMTSRTWMRQDVVRLVFEFAT